MSTRTHCQVIVLLFLLACNESISQDYSVYTQFFVNPSFLNASYTGMDGRPALFLSYRKQWAGFPGSPSLAGVSIQGPLPGNLALGLTLMNDKKGLISTSLASFTGAYPVMLANDKMIRFGLSIGAGSNKVDLTQLNFVTPGDNVLTSLASSNIEVMGNAGISFHTPTFHAGFSLPNIFQPVYVSPNAFNVSSIKPFENMIFHASNRFYFAKDKNVFEPYVVYRLRGNLPSQFEVAGLLHLQNLAWIGASYKQDFGISALAGFTLNKQAALGYSYSVKTTGDNAIGRPSHEIHLGLLLGVHKKNTPLYSFVNTEKEKKGKTPQELALEKKKREEALALEKKKKEEALALEKKKQEEALALALEKKKQEDALAYERKKNEDVAARRKADSLATVSHSEEEEKERIRLLAEHKEDPDAHHGLADTVHAHAERHEFVKRGTHASELDSADYVIIGAFRGKENAQHFTKGLLDLGFQQAHYGFISARNLWYVYIASGNDIEVVRLERDRYRKMKMFKDAWLLTVHD